MTQELEPIEQGFSVLDIEGLAVGQVIASRPCCIEIAFPSQRVTRASVTTDGIFSVQVGEVTLVCSGANVGRYLCPTHR